MSKIEIGPLIVERDNKPVIATTAYSNTSNWGVSINEDITSITQEALNDFVYYMKNNKHGKASNCRFSRSQLLAYTRVGGDPEFFIERCGDKTKVPSYNWFGLNPEAHNNYQASFDNESRKSVKKELFDSELYPGWKIFGAPDAPDTNIYDYPYIHPDGFQLELGYTPVDCMESTSIKLYSGFYNTQSALKADNFQISKDTSHTLSHMEALQVPLGCRPSFNAHNIDNNIYVKNPLARFTGGHFHFSTLSRVYQFADTNCTNKRNKYGNLEYKSTLRDPMELRMFNSMFSLEHISEADRQEIIDPVIRAMDATVGILSVALAGNLDSAARREHHYGMAGDYRITPATLEYRVPSNAVWFHPVSWNIIGMWGRAIMRAYLSTSDYNREASFKFQKYINNIKNWGTIIDIINNTDVAAARAYIKENYSTMVQAIYGVESYLSEYNALNKVLYLADNGLQNTLLKDNLSIAQNWQIAATGVGGTLKKFEL